jgi:glutamate-ammonia-ligase adenylyltransferase
MRAPFLFIAMIPLSDIKLPPDLPNALRPGLEDRLAVFEQAVARAGISPETLLPVAGTLPRVFACSDFVAKTCTGRPGLLQDLIDSGDLASSVSGSTYRQRLLSVLGDPAAATEETAAVALRRFRQREMVRIAWRDIAGQSRLGEVMEELSALAEACLQTALDVLYARQMASFGQPVSDDGEPQQLVVIAMGKLGARELNFSSDIDLIFAYPRSGQTRGAGRSIGNEEFFLRLCRRLVKVIGAGGADGQVFRVDLNLRPYGENGPLVMNFSAMEDYYLRQGREWERYAWIKARVVAGDHQAGGRLLEVLRPFIYRRYLDYGAFESLRDMKTRIVREVKRRRLEDNIKLGRGGIREIEFFGQMFQLIRGGVTPRLQRRRILEVLAVLADENIVSRRVADELASAYRFLRRTENRLQEFEDRQIHRLPADPVQRVRLAYAMGFAGWEAFSRRLEKAMRDVHRHFDQLLAGGRGGVQASGDEDSATARLEEIWRDVVFGEDARRGLHGLGFECPDEIINQLDHLRDDALMRGLSLEARRRLDKLMPLLLDSLRPAPDAAVVLGRIVDLLKTILRRSSYLALLLENRSALTHLVRLAGASPWIINHLTRHPVLLDELLDPRTLYTPPRRDEIERDLKSRLAHIDPADLEYQIEAMNVFQQACVLRVAAADVTGHLPLMRTSDHLTDIAEVIVSEVLELAWRHLIERHGLPACSAPQDTTGRGFAVVAYGKLGGIELGYGSDLDLVFLHAGGRGQTTGGRQPVDEIQFFARLGQRVVHILTAHTAAGVLYEADMRLRPSGSSGLLVSHIDAFEEYQLEKAWTWEHQAIIRARAIAGDRALMERFNEIRARVLSLPRDRERLRREVTDMRERMRRERLKPSAENFNLKQDRGGVVDIEFLVQYLVLLHARARHELLRWTDNVRLLEELTRTGVLSDTDAYLLRETYLAFRQRIHRLDLQEKPARVPRKSVADSCARVWRLWQRYLGDTEA